MSGVEAGSHRNIAGNILILFLCAAYALFSLTQFGISVGTFGLILSDMLIIISAMIGLFTFRTEKKYGRVTIFIILTAILFVLTALSIVNSISPAMYLSGMLPWFFTIVFLFVFIRTIRFNPTKFLRLLKIFLVLALAINSIPAILSLAGLRLDICFDPVRYRGFTINANQVISHILVTIFIYGTIEFHEKKSGLRTLLVCLLSLPALLLSGSRTATIIVFGLLAVTLLLLFFKLNFGGKIKFAIVAFALVMLSLPVINQFIENNFAVQRGLLILSYATGEEKLDASAQTRDWQREYGTKLYMENPIFGVGINQFKEYYHQEEVHNTYVNALYETGTLGFIAMLFFWAFLYATVLFSPNLNRSAKFFVLATLALFTAMNTYHIFFRERWVWFYFIFIVYLSTPLYKQHIVKKQPNTK